MQLASGARSALVAVLREGSFERAAQRLHVTASAVSQRIRQLEEQVGAVLVVRSSPCRPTEIGELVHRHALQMEMLEHELSRTLTLDGEGEGAPTAPLHLAIAVNADSLATWVVPAVAEVARAANLRIEIIADDESQTVARLRAGEVVGAVTSSARAVRSCDVTPLGSMRYLATATPEFRARWLEVFPEGLEHAPSLAFDRTDGLSERFVTELLGRAPSAGTHYFPSPEAYLSANLAGLAWGLNPESLVRPHLESGALVSLWPEQALEVPLYWQCWAIRSPGVEALSQTMIRFGRAALSMERAP